MFGDDENPEGLGGKVLWRGSTFCEGHLCTPTAGQPKSKIAITSKYHPFYVSRAIKNWRNFYILSHL